MTATLKTTIIQEPSSSTANMTLNTSGGVDFGASSTIATVPIVTTTGTQTLTNKTLTSPTINTPTMGGSVITSGTAQNSTSGTSIDFTGIPSWVKRITIMLQGVSTNGTSLPLIQLGTSSGPETSGYLGTSSSFNTAPAPSNLSSGFLVLTQAGAAANVIHGIVTIANLSGNNWVCNGVLGASNTTIAAFIGGSKSLAATLDRVRITTVNGTDTFDAGTINIIYE